MRSSSSSYLYIRLEGSLGYTRPLQNENYKTTIIASIINIIGSGLFYNNSVKWFNLHSQLQGLGWEEEYGGFYSLK